MLGMNAKTGRYINGIEHLKQSITDILTTPIGSRVMRRNYGSALMRLLGRPLNAELIAQIQTAVVSALTAFETRLEVHQVEVYSKNHNSLAAGKIELLITGVYLPDNQTFTQNITL